MCTILYCLIENLQVLLITWQWSDHNCSSISLSTKFCSPSQETKIGVNNKFDKINLADPLTFELNSLTVRQKVDASIENTRINQNLTTDDLVKCFSGLPREVVVTNTTQQFVKLKRKKDSKMETDKPTWFSDEYKTAKENRAIIGGNRLIKISRQSYMMQFKKTRAHQQIVRC